MAELTVLECSEHCGSVVEANYCCGVPMKLKGESLVCNKCDKEVSVNRCCGHSMVQKDMSAKEKPKDKKKK